MAQAVDTLFVVSSPETAREIAGIIRWAGFDALWLQVGTLRAFMSNLEIQDWDLIICEDRLRDFEAVDVVGEAKRRQPAIPVVVLVSERVSHRRIIELHAAGVSGFAHTGEAEELMDAIRGALAASEMARKRDKAEEESVKYRTYLEDLVTTRTEDLRKVNRKLMAEIDLHRATVKALRASEEAFRAVAETAPDITARFDRGFRYLYINPAIERVSGIHRADFLGKTSREIGVPEEVARSLEKEIKEVFSTGSVGSTYLDFPRPGGHRTYHIRLAPEFSRSEEVESVVAVGRDITEARSAEAALRRSEASFRALSENAPCIILRLGEDLKIVHANPASQEVTGRDASSLQGLRFDEVGLPERPAELLVSMFLQTFRTGRRGHVKTTIDLEGRARAFEVLMVPERSEEGRVETVLAIAYDITEAEKAREVLARDKAEFQKIVEKRTAELIATQMELVEAKRLSDIGTLAATVAHELRNPLAVIQSAVYNIKRKCSDTGLGRHVGSIERKIAESDQIISNLLNYSRLKQPQPEETSISALLDEHLKAAKGRYPEHKVEIIKQMDGVGRLLLRIDRRQMGEVFANVLNNAYDALPDGGGRITVSAQVDEAAGKVSVSFSDNGKGMSETELRRAQDPFFTTKSKGTGLGLAICRDIVRLHGGSLDIKSSPGMGTTVKIILPS
jgi:PAS domain S-box-containing protein